MASVNAPVKEIKTHEGGTAKQISAEMQLRRSVMSCMLWEDGFYESGVTIADRITDLASKLPDDIVSSIAIEAREKQKLRHVPLLLARIMAKNGSKLTAKTLERIIQRPDELTEFLSLYWKDKRQPLSNQVKKGLAAAFVKFNEYELQKYNRLDKAVKLRDVLFLSHAKPKDDEQAAVWKKLIANELATPDTWETRLSSGQDKKEAWTDLLNRGRLGALALIRNLRNMTEAKVSDVAIKDGLTKIKTERVLPFRFIAAARHAPRFESQLEEAMYRCVEGKEKLSGQTILLIDVSGSMDEKISAKSDMRRIDAACGLAILAREVFADVRVFTFSNSLVEVPPRRGFALRDAVMASQPHGGTEMGGAVKLVNTMDYDRLIVITDEQSASRVPDPKRNGTVINVASNKNGVGYHAWQHVDGWSEAVLDYIVASEGLK